MGQAKSYSGVEDTQLSVNSASGVLAGATDVEGNTPLTATLVSNGSKGSVVLNANGSFVYTPMLMRTEPILSPTLSRIVWVLQVH